MRVLDSYVIYWWTTPRLHYDPSEWEGWSNVHEYDSDNNTTSMSDNNYS